VRKKRKVKEALPMGARVTQRWLFKHSPLWTQIQLVPYDSFLWPILSPPIFPYGGEDIELNIH
jgi:hypothetical protein